MNKQNKNYERSQCKLRGLVRNIAGAQKKSFHSTRSARRYERSARSSGYKPLYETQKNCAPLLRLKKLHTFADKQKKAHKCEGTFIYFDGNAVFADSRICTAEGGAHSVG